MTEGIMTEEFKIRFQLVRLKNGVTDSVIDSFLMEIPERVSGTLSTKTEAPFLVAQALFDKLRKRLT